MLNSSLKRRACGLALSLAALLSGGWASAKQCPPPTPIPTPAELTAAAQQAEDRGFLWTAERDGKTSYLYGTLHVGKLAWAAPGPRTVQALRESRVLAMELDVGNPQIQQALLSKIQKPGPTSLDPMLQQRMQDAAEQLCVDWNALSTQRPEFQMTSLVVALVRYEGLDAGFGTEVVLAGMAPHLRLPVRGLETVDEQVNALSLDSPSELAEWLNANLLALSNGQARRLTRELARTWSERDLQRLESYPDWCECMDTELDRMVAERLLDRRNHPMAERIDKLHAQEGPAFVAVGSLHMVGPNGLPALLKARGFTVKQVF